MSPQHLRCLARATQHPAAPEQTPARPGSINSTGPQAAIHLDGPKPGSGNLQEASSSAQGPEGGPQPAVTPKLQSKSSDPCSGPSGPPPPVRGLHNIQDPQACHELGRAHQTTRARTLLSPHPETPAGYTKPSSGCRQSRAPQGRKRTLLREQKPVTGCHRESVSPTRATHVQPREHPVLWDKAADNRAVSKRHTQGSVPQCWGVPNIKGTPGLGQDSAGMVGAH
ncbi:hypothetical protein NDU88_008936 [Pleurodeles waltl]|uniref:Uncharacterized protein n=1 Tax=Pleurodeles waltl TaxID=8319 RepID=A0AAV7PUF3_PLEWA|nr:hypothetical protein NDU88_008936 [Pleurodeles waltl]